MSAVLATELRWNLDPVILSALLVTAFVYALGVRRLWSRGIGRGVSLWEPLAFAGGLLAVAAALVSPIDTLAASLFWVHMCQHMLLIVVAPPLLLLGRPLLVMPQGLPPEWRRRLPANPHPRRALGLATATWLLHVGVVWVWHVPVLFQAALIDPAIHALEHAMFLGTALLFWWWLIEPSARRQLGEGAAVVYAIAAGVQGTAFGALLLFSGRPWYRAYASGAAAFHLTPLKDQQLAGLVMWLPPGIVYLVAAAMLFLGLLRSTEREALRSELGATGGVPASNGHVSEVLG